MPSIHMLLVAFDIKYAMILTNDSSCLYSALCGASGLLKSICLFKTINIVIKLKSSVIEYR